MTILFRTINVSPLSVVAAVFCLVAALKVHARDGGLLVNQPESVSEVTPPTTKLTDQYNEAKERDVEPAATVRHFVPLPAQRAPPNHKVVGVHGTVIKRCLDAYTLKPAFRSRRDAMAPNVEKTLAVPRAQPFVEDYEPTAPCNDGKCTFKTRSYHTASVWYNYFHNTPYPSSAWSLPYAWNYLSLSPISEALERATFKKWERKVPGGLMLCTVDAVPKTKLSASRKKAARTKRVVCPCKATVEEVTAEDELKELHAGYNDYIRQVAELNRKSAEQHQESVKKLHQELKQKRRDETEGKEEEAEERMDPVVEEEDVVRGDGRKLRGKEEEEELEAVKEGRL